MNSQLRHKFDYRTYCLRKRSQRHDNAVAQKVSKLSRRWKSISSRIISKARTHRDKKLPPGVPNVLRCQWRPLGSFHVAVPVLVSRPRQGRNESANDDQIGKEEGQKVEDVLSSRQPVPWHLRTGRLNRGEGTINGPLFATDQYG